MKNMKRIALVVAITLLLGCAIGGTLAWLTDTTQVVTNTFTTSDVEISLTETDSADDDTNANENAYKMVPGNVIAKDPKVTVEAISEACWLFVKVNESANVDSYLDYSVITGTGAWQPLTGVDNVYYMQVADSDVAQSFDVIYYDVNSDGKYQTGEENKVHVKTTVDKAMMETAKTSVPTITFKAFAVQQANIVDDNNNGTAVDEAWATIPADVK